MTLTANPAVGWLFDHWEGDLASGAAEETITVDTNKNVTAVFVKEIYTITTANVGMGMVGLSPQKAGYTYGEEVEVSVAPMSGWYFDHWEGDLDGTETRRTITVDGNKAVMAFFGELGSISGYIECSGGNVTVVETLDTQYYNNPAYFTFNNLRPGIHHITLKKPGYNSTFHTVNVKPGQTANVGSITCNVQHSRYDEATNRITLFDGPTISNYTFTVGKEIKWASPVTIYARENYEAGGVSIYKNKNKIDTLDIKYQSKSITIDPPYTSVGFFPSGSNGVIVNVSCLGDIGKPIINISNDFGYGSAWVDINATDRSGIKKVEYSWSTSFTSPGTYSTISNGGTAETTAKGVWYLHVRVTDNSDNVSTMVEGPYIIP